MTEERYYEFLEEYDKVCEEAEEALQWYNDNIKKIDGLKHLFVTELGSNGITFSGEESWAYGGHEDYGFYLDINFLYNQEYREEKKAEVLKAKKKVMNVQVQNDKKAKALKEAKEKATYLELKEKYEGKP
jgi:hypothetical protein